MTSLRWLVVASAVVAVSSASSACRRAPAPDATALDPSGHIEDCRRLYGLPPRYGDHSPLVRRLVDRYGATPAEADGVALLYVMERYRQLDSMVAAQEESLAAGRDSARRERARMDLLEKERVQAIEDSFEADRARRTLIAEADRRRGQVRIDLTTQTQFDTVHLSRGYFLSRDVIKGVYNGLQEPIRSYKVTYQVEDTERKWTMSFPKDSVTLGSGVYRVRVQVGSAAGDHDVIVELTGEDAP